MGPITHGLVFLILVYMPLLNASEKCFEDGYSVGYVFPNCHDWNVSRMRVGLTSANPQSRGQGFVFTLQRRALWRKEEVFLPVGEDTIIVWRAGA